ncbi:hypothetical protein J3F83DRAFT_740683 [Trichoderma novae-zelandiae]
MVMVRQTTQSPVSRHTHTHTKGERRKHTNLSLSPLLPLWPPFPHNPEEQKLTVCFRLWPDSTVLSVFAIVILSVLGVLFRSGHEQLVGGIDDPADGKAVSKTVFSAVFVYIAFFVFCGLQGLLHIRENRRGAISL